MRAEGPRRKYRSENSVRQQQKRNGRSNRAESMRAEARDQEITRANATGTGTEEISAQKSEQNGERLDCAAY